MLVCLGMSCHIRFICLMAESGVWASGSCWQIQRPRFWLLQHWWPARQWLCQSLLTAYTPPSWPALAMTRMLNSRAWGEYKQCLMEHLLRGVSELLPIHQSTSVRRLLQGGLDVLMQLHLRRKPCSLKRPMAAADTAVTVGGLSTNGPSHTKTRGPGLRRVSDPYCAQTVASDTRAPKKTGAWCVTSLYDLISSHQILRDKV